MHNKEFIEFINEQLLDDSILPPVHGENHLPFEKLNPKTFEVLCCKIADKLFDDARIYGHEGQAQHGIDITCWTKKPVHNNADYEFVPKGVFIQCKRVEKFGVIEFRKVVELFLAGKFKEGARKFIVCIAKECSASNLQDEYRRLQQELKKENIEFLLWDAIGLENRLKGYPQIVYDIFDRDEFMMWTSAFCGENALEFIKRAFRPFPEKQQVAAIENYIARKIYYYNPSDKWGAYSIYSGRYDEIATLLRKHEPSKILLLIIAGAGKTTEINHLEHIFSHPEERLYPVRVELNDYTGGGFEAFIERYEEHFSQYDPNKIVLLLDGYDEVIAEKLEETVRDINQFLNPKGRYKNTRVVLSSRSNFYKENFKDFATYFLYDVEDAEIWNYVSKRLGNQAHLFIRVVKERNLIYLLSNAFNLIKLVEIFSNTGADKFPRNRTEAFDRIIEMKLEKDSKRPSEKLEFNYNIEKIKCAAEIIAFSMQQLGKNKLSGYELRKVIPDKNSIELLHYSSLINNHIAGKDEWQFDHNNYQEFFAARVLSRLTVEEIKFHVSFDGCKIKPRWVNTLSFLFSILSNTEEKHQQLLQWIIQIEPTVVVKFEREVLSPHERLKIISAVFNHYKSKNILLRSDTLRGEDLARFCGAETIFGNYILNEIETADSNEHITNLIETIQHISLPSSLTKRARQLLLSIIQSSKWEAFTIHDAIASFFSLGFNSIHDINEVIATCAKFDSHRARYAVYSYLSGTQLCNSYIDFFLEGLTIHKKETKKLKIHDYTYDLMTCIHNCNQAVAINKILEFAIEHCEEEYKNADDYYTYQDEKLVSGPLVENCILAYKEDNCIFSIMIRLIRYLSKYHNREQLNYLHKFFTDTETSIKAMLELMPDFIENKSIANFAFIADEKCIDFIVNQYLNNEITDDLVVNILSSFSWTGCKASHDSFYEKINKATNNKFIYNVVISHEEKRASQHLFDLKLLQNKEAFLKETDAIFSSFEQEELNSDDLYSWRKNKFSEDEILHTIPLKALQDLAREDKHIRKENIHSKFKDISDWEWFVMYHIHKMLERNRKIDEWHINFITNWCYEELKQCNYRKAVWYAEDSTLMYEPREHTVSFFWKHLAFELPETTLLDMLSFDFSGFFIPAKNDNPPEKTLSDYVVERVKDKKALEREILNCLTSGTIVSEVAGSLIRQCKNLRLSKYANIILEWMVSGKLSKYSMSYIIDAYLELDSNKQNLIILLDTTDGSEYWHWHLIRLLKKDFTNEITSHVQKCFENLTISEDHTQETLAILITAGHHNAWLLFKERVFSSKNIGLRDVKEIELNKLSVEPVVSDLFEMLLFSHKKNFGGDRVNDYSSEISELIFKVGLSCEFAFNLVIENFNKAIALELAKNPRNNSLCYMQQRFERNYFLNKNDSLTLNDVIENNKYITKSLQQHLA